MRRFILGGIVLAVTHGGALAIGFALGVYLLPILTAPKSPDAAALREQAQAAVFTGNFQRDLRGSDFLHWGEGRVSIAPTRIVHEGKLAPGPDYKVYLLDRFVEHEEEFLPIKHTARLVGDVKSFDGFVLDVPPGIDPAAYTTILIWCEAFSEFISAARYR